MKEIPLTQGKVALVSDEDFERVSAFKWMASISNTHRRHSPGSAPKWYACRFTELPRCPKTGKRRRKMVYLHRFLLDAPEGMVVDHFPDPDGLNCTRENLRIATYAENRATSTQDRSNEW